MKFHLRFHTAAVFLLAVFAASCSNGIDVNLHLVNPCQEDVLFKDNQCQFLRLTISSLDPQDILHPSHIGDPGGGPIARTCNIGDGSCNIAGDELMGLARIVDILCFTSLETAPVARATSQAMMLAEGAGSVGSTTMNLMIANIDTFTETTVLSNREDPSTVGDCSLLGQGEIGRYGHTATLLDDGRVLIAGGIRRLGTVEDVLSTAEIFDPVSGRHQLVVNQKGEALKMAAPSGRAFHTATRLRDGRVLLAGGVGLVEGQRSTLQSAELFDPYTNTFGTISVMGSGRAHHTATMLATGEVLVTGGASYNSGVISTYFNNAIIYRPDTNAWEPVGSNMSVARAFHQAVLLDPSKYNGNVVVIGGENADGPHNTIDIYNAQANQFYSNVNVTMDKNRSHLCAVRLANGEVMVAGGKTTVDDTSVDAEVEIYNPGVPDFGEFRAETTTLQVARMDHTCTLLDTDNVLVTGGMTSSSNGIGIGELVLVGSGSYSVQTISDDFLDPPRFSHTATLLRNGWVFITGGLPSAAPEAVPVAQSMYFTPEPTF